MYFQGAMLIHIVLFQKMGNTQTSYDMGAFIDVMTHLSNLPSDDAANWGNKLKEYMEEQKRLHTRVDLMPDR